MNQYKIDRAGRAVKEFDELRNRATSEGKLDLFEWRYDEIVRALTDPLQALHKGFALRSILLKPGLFERHWLNVCLYVRYVIFPDHECGWITHIEFVPPWA